MSFADEITAGGNVLMETTMKITRKAVGNLCDNVIDRTPVLTGNLQSGWRGTTDSGDLTELGIQQVANITSADVTKSKVRAVIERWDGMRPFYLHDPVIYGPMIEYDGWSWKAPAGMVRVSAAIWPLLVRDAVLEVGGG